MKSRLLFRLLFWNVLLIALTVGVLDFILNSVLRTHLERRIERQLRDESAVVAAYLQPVRETAEIDEAADRLSAMLSVRVTVIDSAGYVLGDSELEGKALAEVENHSNRPEVREALEKGTGSAVRYSSTVRTDYMYLARKTDRGVVRLAVPLTTVVDLVSEFRTQLVIASLVAVAFTLLFGYFVILRVANPIRQIAVGARRLATGDLSLKVPVHGNDEIAALAEALNTMAQNLSSRMREIRNTEKMRRDFVANVSHEFKTPLTSIRGYAETLLAGAGDDPALRTDFLNVIERNARHLEALVRDLLTLAKIEAELPALKELVDVRAVLEELLAARQGILQTKKIRVEVDSPPVILQADRSRLIAAVSNLIDNAINYNRPGGRIRISARIEDDRSFSLSVADTGQGIPSEEIPRIFERFYRVDKARSRESGGTGLGLAIAKHAVESQDGRITVQSQPGSGSTFTIRLSAESTRVEVPAGTARAS